MVGATYVLLPASQGKPQKQAATLKFFDWAFSHGSATVLSLDYIPLPEAVVARIRSQWPANATDDVARKPIAGQ